MKDSLDQIIYSWFYDPGEKIRSIGFYQNPYKQLNFAKFDHIWALDESDNLYVGQYSVYPQHLEEIFKITNKQEYGKIYLKGHIDQNGEPLPVVYVENLEPNNIIFINRRLRKIAQRFYDYGVPARSLITSAIHEDLGNTTIYNILKGQPWERPLIKN